MEFKPLYLNEDGRTQSGPSFSITSPQEGDVLKFSSGKWKNASPVSGEPNTIMFDVPCDPAVDVGHVVRVSNGTAYLALADSMAHSNAIGVVEFKSNAALCNIRVSGVTGDLFVDLDDTKEYFLSSTEPGELTAEAPATAGSIMLPMGQPFSDSKFFVARGQRVMRA